MIGLDILTPDTTKRDDVFRLSSRPQFLGINFIFLQTDAPAYANAGILVLQLPFCNIEVNHSFGIQIQSA